MYPSPRPNLNLPASVNKSMLEAQLQSSLNIPWPGDPLSLSDLLDGYPSPAGGSTSLGATSLTSLTTTPTVSTGLTPQVSNRISGINQFAVGTSAYTVTNSQVTTSSIVLVQLLGTNGGLTEVLNVIPGTGTFTVNANSNATSTVVKFGWVVIN